MTELPVVSKESTVQKIKKPDWLSGKAAYWRELQACQGIGR